MSARAMEVALAAREGRSALPMLDITPLDRTELYMEAVLRLPLVSD